MAVPGAGQAAAQAVVAGVVPLAAVEMVTAPGVPLVPG